MNWIPTEDWMGCHGHCAWDSGSRRCMTESSVLGAGGCSQIQYGGEMVAGHFDSSFPHWQPGVNKTLFKKWA